MSSSTSSSSSHSQRSPLHERSNSEKNKLQIRVVPYTPPRLDEVEAGDSHAREAEAGNDGAHHTAINPSGSASTGLTPYGKEGYQGFTSWSPSSTLSPSSPASPSARVQGSRVSASKPSSDSSGAECTAPPAAPVLSKASYGSNIRRINAPTRQSRRHEDDPASPASPTWRKSKYRRDINVHSDKTFSVVLKPVHARYSDRSESSLSQPPLSNTSTVSSHERISFDAPIEDLHSSPLSSVAERSVSSSTPASPTASTELPEDHITSSPENYRLIGGLRKVPRTPDLKNKGKGKEVATRPLPPLPEAPTTPPKTEPSHVVATKSSFSSELSASTVEETTNYKVLGRSSPPLPDSDSIYAPPSSSSPNYKLLGRSSPPKPFVSSPPRPQGSVDTPSSQNFAVPSDIDTPGSKNFIVHRNIDTPRSRNFIAYSDIDTPQSQDLIGYSDVDTPGSRNFVVHGNPSASSSVYAFARRPRRYSSDDSLHEILAKYSQESLVIAPLEARKRPLSERFGHYKQNSRDSLRGRADSFSSISSIVSQDTPNIVRFHSTASISSIPQTSWAGPSRPSSVGTSRALMDTHQWSSQLSTVPSEYEGTERSSRVISIGSLPDRSSSARGSRNSRQIRSISSSILENLEPSQSHSRSNSRSDSLERPAPVFARGARELPSPPLRTVRDVDEHGDGLADLQHLHQLQNKSSRSRLGFSSRQSSNRSLRSSASSRSGSIHTSIPAWARLYYGSGERRWLAAPSMRSEGGESRPGSSWAASGSPSLDDVASNIHNPRHRPQEVHDGRHRPDSMEITSAGIGDIRRAPKRMTSSIWSPHLRMDRRATRYSIWEAPSVSWSAESGMFGKRNIQVVLFILGFGIPFAWMIAAFLPLPPKPMVEMQQRDRSTTTFRTPEEADPESLNTRVGPMDDSRFQSARWWRNLNRFMSIVGLLLLGAVAALVVIGLRQNW